jgi:hypothetical protein
MAQSILIFDFGTNEDAAQQGRHKVDAWQQGFRLGKKILLKFDRKESNGSGAVAVDKPAEGTAAKGKSAEKASAAAESGTGKDAKTVSASGVRLLIRLDFSDHEKLTLQRWLDRIPSEEPFKSAKGETVRHGDAAFAATSELFDSLD